MITHKTIQLTKNISCLSANHETDRPVLAAIWGERSNLVVDAGNSPAHARLMLDLLAQNKEPVTTLPLWFSPTGTGTTSLV